MMFKRVLALSPHTDDCEFGCGATIAKFVDKGLDVFYIAFSAAEKSVPESYPRNILREEVRTATEILGIRPGNLFVLDFDVREFENSRQLILDTLIKFRENIKPDLVLIPSSQDIHQDHQALFQEAVRAFKHSSLLGYELPWNNMSFSCRCLIPVTWSQLQRKISAMEAYKSQSNRHYANRDFLISLARVRGTQMGETYAEAYDAIRILLQED